MFSPGFWFGVRVRVRVRGWVVEVGVVVVGVWVGYSWGVGGEGVKNSCTMAPLGPRT